MQIMRNLASNKTVVPFFMGILITLMVIEIRDGLNIDRSNKSRRQSMRKNDNTDASLIRGAENENNKIALLFDRTHVIAPSFSVCSESVTQYFERSEIVSAASAAWDFFSDLHTEASLPPLSLWLLPPARPTLFRLTSLHPFGTFAARHPPRQPGHLHPRTPLRALRHAWPGRAALPRVGEDWRPGVGRGQRQVGVWPRRGAAGRRGERGVRRLFDRQPRRVGLRTRCAARACAAVRARFLARGRDQAARAGARPKRSPTPRRRRQSPRLDPLPSAVTRRSLSP